MTTDVLIVGAGPTGLTMANLLARYEINFRIIDKNAGSTDKSKALAVQARTLELFDKIGLADRALEKGQIVTGFNILIEGKHTESISFSSQGEKRTPYPFVLILEQSKTEGLLIEGLQDFNSRIEWNTELLNLTQTGNEARAVVRRPDSSEEPITANWVVGADGASSPVRRSLNLDFEGGTYEQSYFLADVKMDWPLSYDELYVNLSPQGFLAFFPMYGNHRFRLIGDIPPEFAASSDISFEDICKIAEQQSNFDLQLSDPRWISRYRLHHRMTERFRVGRCFLAGDAAHIHSPVGGQGMNTGIQDAYNLAWKLALVIKKQAHPHLLDSYEAERLPVARHLLMGTDRAFSFISSRNEVVKQFRLHIFPHLADFFTHLGLARNLLFKVVSEISIDYDESPIVAESIPTNRSAQSPEAGDRAPYGLLEAGSDEQASLFNLLKGTEHHLLLFEGLRAEPKLDTLQKQLRNLLDRYEVSTSIHIISTENRDLHKRYNAEMPSLFLIRPDGYIAYRGQPVDLDDLKAYLDNLFIK